MQQSIPSQLVFRRTNSRLTNFYANINDDEFFFLTYAPDQPGDYRWQLSICSAIRSQNVFLHGHTDRQDAEAAARRHLGME